MLDINYVKRSAYLDMCDIVIDTVGDTFIDDFWFNDIFIDGTYDLTVGSSTARKNTFKRSNSESLTASDRNIQKVNIPKGEAVSFSDGLSKNPKIGKFESLSLGDVKIGKVSITKADALSFLDSLIQKVGLVKGSKLSFTDGAYKAQDFHTAERMAAIETLANKPSVKWGDALSLSDPIYKGQRFYTSEKVSTADKLINNPNLIKSDTISATDTKVGYKIGKTATEKILWSDPFYHKLNIYKRSGVDLSEVYSRTAISKRQFDESLLTKEAGNRKTSIYKSETYSIGEAIRRNGTLNKSEMVKLSDRDTKTYKLYENEIVLNGSLMRSQTSFDRFIKELLLAKEGAFKAIYKPFGETMAAKDSKMTKTVKNLFEVVNGTDELNRTVNFKREFEEEITGTELTKKTYKLFERDDGLSVYSCRVLPNPCGVLSDIRLQNHGLTLSDFTSSIERPSGYNVFSEFKVGEYEYQDAMYRLVISKSNMAANPLVYDYKIHVDIDDVKDRGTAVIPAEETKVYFNRNYYTEPEVVVNVVSGSEGEIIIPFITETDGEDDRGRYFKVVLKNAAGTIVAGTISWNSNGY